MLIFDIKKMEWGKTVEAHDNEVLSLAYSKTSHLLASASRDKLVHVFDAQKNYEKVVTLDNHSSSVTSVKFTNDSKRVISCGGDRMIFSSEIKINEENVVGERKSMCVSKVSERSERALRKTRIRATTKPTHSIRIAPSSLGAGDNLRRGSRHNRQIPRLDRPTKIAQRLEPEEEQASKVLQGERAKRASLDEDENTSHSTKLTSFSIFWLARLPTAS